ncbi:hypothetical protein ACJIZ3_019064 [Penstemon smallii]|uniref:PORR domain-containing protein n=1 Tax=Penstemon smallii TaxID=265156 RepID=A0ABD3T068_9LAMI
MNFLHRAISSDLGRHRYHIRTLYDGVSSMRCPRDRGLDHAVARESHLKPLLNLKNIIISEPSKSIPFSLITQSKQTLDFPFRPIEFIRKYPSVFQEFHPGSLNIQPHIKLTPEVISLSSEEDLFYQSVDYKQEVAGRLLKLLMISRVNKVPLFLLERLKWELGLPRDYENVVIPEFPDYFRVVGGKELELVCWSDEFAVSEMEKKGAKDGNIQFSLQYSKDFEMDKKYKKWVDEWQKLQYMSPYQNAMHLGAKTDESDKWAVAVLHEVLSLFVGKKAERESLLYLGEYLGLRSRFKLAFLQHPGIFYVSTKIGTHTVVLKEAYKRGMLIERHALMNMRSKYIQLMNVVKVEEKSKSKHKKSRVDVKKDEEEEAEDGESGEEKDVEMSDDDESDDSEEEEEEEEDEEEEGEGENAKREKFERHRANFEERNSERSTGRRSIGRSTKDNEYTSSTRSPRRNNSRDDPNEYGSSTRFSKRTNVHGDPNEYASSNRFPKRTYARGGPNVYSNSKSFSRTNNRGDPNEYSNTESFSRRANNRGDPNEDASSTRFSRRTNTRGDSNEHGSSMRFSRRTNTRGDSNEYSSSTRFSKRTNVRDDPNVPRRSPQKFDDVSGNRPRSRTERTRT